MNVRLEALADAFSAMNGMHDPSSEAYQLRNPLRLRAFNPKHERNANGLRRFKTFVAGYDNGLLDLLIKCSGKSRAKLTPHSQLVELVAVYGNSPAAVKNIVRFLRTALDDETVSDSTPLRWFIEEDKRCQIL